jgi:hypothetical protein
MHCGTGPRQSSHRCPNRRPKLDPSMTVFSAVLRSVLQWFPPLRQRRPNRLPPPPPSSRHVASAACFPRSGARASCVCAVASTRPSQLHGPMRTGRTFSARPGRLSRSAFHIVCPLPPKFGRDSTCVSVESRPEMQVQRSFRSKESRDEGALREGNESLPASPRGYHEGISTV